MTRRNYRIVGLTEENSVVIQLHNDDRLVDTHAPPSEYLVDWLPRNERGILRKGMTSSGEDREKPRGDVLEASSSLGVEPKQES